MLRIVSLLAVARAVDSSLGATCHRLLKNQDDVSTAMTCRERFAPSHCLQLMQALGPAPWSLEARQRACGVVEQIGYRGLLDTPLDKAVDTKAKVQSTVATVPPTTPVTVSEGFQPGQGPVPVQGAEKTSEDKEERTAQPLPYDLGAMISKHFTAKGANKGSTGVQSSEGSQSSGDGSASSSGSTWSHSSGDSHEGSIDAPALSIESLGGSPTGQTSEGSVDFHAEVPQETLTGSQSSSDSSSAGGAWSREQPYHASAAPASTDWSKFFSHGASESPTERKFQVGHTVRAAASGSLTWAVGLVALVSLASSLAIRWRPVAFRQGAYSRLEAEVSRSSRELRVS